MKQARARLVIVDGNPLFAVDRSTVDRAADFLRTEYGFRQYVDEDEYHARIRTLAPPTRRHFDAVMRLQDRVAWSIREGALSRRDPFHGHVAASRARNLYYDMLGDPSVGALIHSLHWSSIISRMCMALAIHTSCGLQGPILDLGCSTGYMARWLARETGEEVTGVDQSAPCIADAARRSAGENVRFVAARFESLPTDRLYGFVYSFDACNANWARDILFEECGELLHPRCVAIMSGDNRRLDSYRSEMSDPGGVSLLHAEQCGGYSTVTCTGPRIDSWPVWALTRWPTEGTRFLNNLTLIPPAFQAYCDSLDVPVDERTQAHFLASYPPSTAPSLFPELE